MKQFQHSKEENSNDHEMDAEKKTEGDIQLHPDDDSVIHEIHLSDENSTNKRWRKFGNGYAAFFDKNDSPWITIGPNYGFVACLVVFVLFFELISYLAISIIADDYWIVKTIGYLVSGTIFVSMGLTVLLNPGHPISKNAQIPPSRNEWCTICKCPKLIAHETIHCKICDLLNELLKIFVCVEEYDHHCPWMGKCIGKGNIAWFYIFSGSFTVILAGIFLFSFFVILPQALKKNNGL